MEFQLEDCSIKVTTKDGKTKVKAFSGYNSNVSTLMTLEDNGNGYYVKSKSYSSMQQDHIFNLDYTEIEYLYYAYKCILEGKG